MPIALPESVKKVLEDKAYGHVVTLNPNGRPQVTMVWMDVEGNEALFNTAEGRKKAQNLRRDPRIIISVQNRNEPQSYLVLNGTATVTETGADAHADKLARCASGIHSRGCLRRLHESPVGAKDRHVVRSRPGGHWHTEDRAASRWHVCEDVVIPRADHLAGAAEPLYPDRDTPGWHLPDIAHVAADRPPSLSHGAITP